LGSSRLMPFPKYPAVRAVREAEIRGTKTDIGFDINIFVKMPNRDSQGPLNIFRHEVLQF